MTFDDGHYSVYKYRYLLDEYNCDKIIFITPSYVSYNKRNDEPDLKEYYQYDYRINHKSQFMNLYEIEDLIKNHNVQIGMHSYYHDFVYIKGENDKDKLWRMYKISTNIPQMKVLNRLYTIKSKLSIQGMEVKDGKLYERDYNEFLTYIQQDTQMCIEWFKKYFGNIKIYAYPFFDYSKELNQELEKYGIEQAYAQRLKLK